MPKTTLTLLILIPAYNEESTIGDVINAMSSNMVGIDKTEVLVVDDGSVDATAQVAQGCGATVVSHPRNLGVGQAMRTGFDYAIQHNVDILISIDADGQFDPDDIPKLIQPILDGQTDFVSGSKFMDPSVKQSTTFINLIGNKMLAWLISKVVGVRFYDVSCGFRAYSQTALMWLNLFGRFDCNQEMFVSLARHNIIAHEVPIQATKTKRPSGKSHAINNLPLYSLRLSVTLLRTIRDANPFLFFGIPSAMMIITGTLFYITFWVYALLELGAPPLSRNLATVGWVLVAFGLVMFTLALFADMVDRIRLTQEEALFHLRKKTEDE